MFNAWTGKMFNHSFLPYNANTGNERICIWSVNTVEQISAVFTPGQLLSLPCNGESLFLSPPMTRIKGKK